MQLTGSGIRLLGPLEVRSAQGPVPLPGEKARAVLALLTLQHRRPVPAVALIDAVWGQAPPPTAANAVQVYITGIRKALRDAGLGEAIGTAGGGYRLEVPEGAVDREVFLAMRARAAAAIARGRRDLAARDYRAALALWRGGAISDIQRIDAVRAQAEQLDELEQTTFEALAANELARGRAGELLPELAARGAAAPLRESLWALIALAQYQLGDQAGSLRSLHRIRAALHEEFGVTPGPRLLMLETAIRRHDPGLLLPEQVTRESVAVTEPAEPAEGAIPPQAASAPAVLLLPDGSRLGLTQGVIVIGRDPGCDLVLQDRTVSGMHARIRAIRGGHVIEDLGSSNSTVVNEVPIARTALAAGDEIRLGRVLLRFLLER